MQPTLNHIKKIILLLIAMQILNNGLFAQDVLYNSGEAAIIRTTSEFIAKNVFHKIPSKPKHKHQKHRQVSLKHSVVKFVTDSSFSFENFDKMFVINHHDYSFYIPTYTNDIAPKPPKA